MIVDPKSALILQPEEAWNRIFKEALEAAGFRVTVATTAIEALTLAADRYFRVFVIDSHAAFVAEREIGGRAGIARNLTWVLHLGAIEENQILILTGPSTDESLVPGPRSWPATTGWIDRLQGVTKARTRLLSLLAGPPDAVRPSWTASNDRRSNVRVALTGTLMGISETGIAVRAPLFAPRALPGFQCVAEIFKSIGVKMPHAFLAECERLPEVPSADQMPQATLRFQIVGWNEADRASLRSWITQNRLKAVEL